MFQMANTFCLFSNNNSNSNIDINNNIDYNLLLLIIWTTFLKISFARAGKKFDTPPMVVNRKILNEIYKFPSNCETSNVTANEKLNKIFSVLKLKCIKTSFKRLLFKKANLQCKLNEATVSCCALEQKYGCVQC